MEKLAVLLKRTGVFHNAVHAYALGLVPAAGARHQVAFQSGVLSMEHAAAALVLVNNRLFSSAYTLMRPQYECLVRGVWLLYAASDTWVEKLGEPLALESASRANEGPMLAEMFKQLDAASKAPKALVEQLKQYRDVTWKAMNSYAHGGLHPLSRTLTGYPAQLTFDVMRNSNAIVAIAAQLSAILTGDPQNIALIRKFHAEFADCLPILG